MKKVLLTLTAVAAMTGTAFAADMAPRTYAKAPAPVVAAANWTGCFVGAGGGGAYIKRNHQDLNAAGTPLSISADAGLDGWFGTVQAGCDYQFAGTNWLIGGFADVDFSDISGNYNMTNQLRTTKLKQDYSWAVGARLGYVVLPQLLTYVSGGFTQAHFKSSQFTDNTGALVADTLPSRTVNGWFIGAGDEYALSFLPGLFWKTEYRYSKFNRVTDTIINPTTATVFDNSRSSEHSVRSEIVYRFNWSGPVVARY